MHHVLNVMKLIIFLLFITTQVIFAATPKQTVTMMRDSAKKGDFETTWKHTVKITNLPAQAEEHFKGKVKRMIRLVAQGWDFDIKEEKVMNDCAVVVINESKKAGKSSFDLDPVYLFKQNGEWKVFADLSDWDVIEYVDKSKVDTFKKLEQWFKQRKAVLKKNRE